MIKIEKPHMKKNELSLSLSMIKTRIEVKNGGAC